MHIQQAFTPFVTIFCGYEHVYITVFIDDVKQNLHFKWEWLFGCLFYIHFLIFVLNSNQSVSLRNILIRVIRQNNTFLKLLFRTYSDKSALSIFNFEIILLFHMYCKTKTIISKISPIRLRALSIFVHLITSS